jgi:hypothetical protein
MKKLMFSRYPLHFSLGLYGLILFSDIEHNFILKKWKFYAQIIHALILASNSIFYIFFCKFLDTL